MGSTSILTNNVFFCLLILNLVPHGYFMKRRIKKVLILRASRNYTINHGLGKVFTQRLPSGIYNCIDHHHRWFHDGLGHRGPGRCPAVVADESFRGTQLRFHPAIHPFLLPGSEGCEMAFAGAGFCHRHRSFHTAYPHHGSDEAEQSGCLRA